MEPVYLSIQPAETGKQIKRLLLENGYTIREIQGAFGFENPQAIYKWISGKSLPSLDNFIILSRLLHTSIEAVSYTHLDVYKRQAFCREDRLFYDLERIWRDGKIMSKEDFPA